MHSFTVSAMYVMDISRICRQYIRTTIILDVLCILKTQL